MGTSVRAFSSMRQLADDVILLVEQEIRLARQEIDLKLDQAFSGLVMAIAGVLAAFVALGVFVQAMIAALATEMEAWLAAVIVGSGFLILAIVLLVIARRNLKPRHLAPLRTIDSLSRTAKTVKESIS
jgi:membrane protein implicated in regulation of membrane protease activity